MNNFNADRNPGGHVVICSHFSIFANNEQLGWTLDEVAQSCDLLSF